MRASPDRGYTVIAISDPTGCAWAAHALSCAGVPCLIVLDRADLFEALTTEPAALIVGDGFDGLSTRQVLAFLATADCLVPTYMVERLDDRRAIVALISAVRRIAGLPAPSPLTARSAAGTSG